MSEAFVKPAAEHDLRAAYQGYSEASENTANRFLTEFEKECNQLVRLPTLGFLIVEDVRCKIMKRFPYKILYHAADEQIVVFALFHKIRGPDYITQRIDFDA
ncbi:MAG: type II toxin-antitoxin system RelE/ParE family toxin [Verrucomicrobiota bacterium]